MRRMDNDSLILYKLIIWLNETQAELEEAGDELENFAGAGFLYARANQIDKVLAKIKMLEAGL